MPEVASDPLLSLIRERGLLDDLQYEEVVQEVGRTGKPVLQVVQDYGLLDLDSALQIIADHLGTMVVAVDMEQMTPEVIATIPADSARMHQCVPVALYGDTVQVALADPLNPAVLALIGITAKAANAAGIHVGVCGGLAGDPLGARILIGLGVNDLSMSTQDVAIVKTIIRSETLSNMQQLAQRALAAGSAAEVRAL